MTGLITTGSFAQSIRPLRVKQFGLDYADAESIWKQMFEVVPSVESYVEETINGGLGLPAYTAEGEAVHYDSAKQGWTKRYRPLKYTNGFMISQEMIEDGNGDVVSKLRTSELKKAFLEADEILGANVYNRAFNSSYTGGDGKELCSNAHPLLNGGTFSNLITGNPDFSEAALEAALIQLKTVVNERGIKANLHARMLIIPDALEYDVARLIDNPDRPATADRDINVINRKGKVPDGYLVNTYLTDSDAWFLTTDCVNAMKAIVRREMRMDEDNDFDTQNAKFVASERKDWGWSNPRGILGSAGT